jgi:hypothetical protein
MKNLKITTLSGLYAPPIRITRAISFKIREFYEYDFNPSVYVVSEFFICEARSLRIVSPKIETIRRI